MNREALFAVILSLSAVSARAQTVPGAPAAKPIVASPGKASGRVYGFPVDGDRLPFGLDHYQRGLSTLKTSSFISPWGDHDVIVDIEVCDKSYHDPMEGPRPDCEVLQFDFYKQLVTDLKAMAVTLDGAKVANLFDRGRGPELDWLDGRPVGMPSYAPAYEVGADGRVAVFLKR